MKKNLNCAGRSKRIRYIFFVIIVFILFLTMFKVPTNEDILNKNQLIEGGGQSNLFPPPRTGYQPPPSFDPNQHLRFNTSEYCIKDFGWGGWTNASGITFEAPASFQSALANISVYVRNATATARTLANEGNSEHGWRLAQGFQMTNPGYFLAYSMYWRGGSSPLSTTMELKENHPESGTTLASIPISISTGNHWQRIALSTPVFLQPGYYYVYLPSTAANQPHWANIDPASPTIEWGEAWGASSGPLVLQPTWNMSLKLETQYITNPSTVGMKVGGVNVQDTGSGYGMVNVTGTISGTSVSYSVVNSSPIEYMYTSHVGYSRIEKTTNQITLTNGYPNWTLTGFAYPGSNFQNYKLNVTGLQSDYFEILAYSGTTPVSYSRPESSMLTFNTAVDRIIFKSPNYITSTEIPTDVHTDQYLELNLTVLETGNLSINIYSNTSVYDNKTYGTGNIQFIWYVFPQLPAGSYAFEAVFLGGTNELGFFTQNITLVKIPALEYYNITVQALEKVVLNYRFYDLFSGSNLEDANVNYYLGDLMGNLQYGITGNYTHEINFATYSFPPGNYEMQIVANKNGYQPLLVYVPVQISPRSAYFDVTRSAKNVLGGESIQITLTVNDNSTGSYLLRPVNIVLKIFPTGTNPQLDALLTGTLIGRTWEGTQSFTIPTGASLGMYDLFIQIDNEFYQGELILTESFLIQPPPDPPQFWLLTAIVGGIALISTSAYVQRMRSRSRHSVSGSIIMSLAGIPIVRRISSDFTTTHPHLISGAVSGIVSLIGEITGSTIRTIVLEGRYLHLTRKDKFWSILLLNHNPSWILKTIHKYVKEIEINHGAEIAEWDGAKDIPIPLDALLKKWFGVEIKELRTPEEVFHDAIEKNATDVKPL